MARLCIGNDCPLLRSIGGRSAARTVSYLTLEVIMRRLFLLVAFAFVLVSGVVVTAAQSTDVQTEEEDAGAPGAGCASPVAASPAASPEASPSLALASTPMATPHASPVALEACGTPPVVGTPGT